MDADTRTRRIAEQDRAEADADQARQGAGGTPPDPQMGLTSDNAELSKPRNPVQLIAPVGSTAVIPASEVSAYVSAATAKNTRRAYRSDLDHFLAWGGSIPSTPEQIAG